MTKRDSSPWNSIGREIETHVRSIPKHFHRSRFAFLRARKVAGRETSAANSLHLHACRPWPRQTRLHLRVGNLTRAVEVGLDEFRNVASPERISGRIPSRPTSLTFASSWLVEQLGIALSMVRYSRNDWRKRKKKWVWFGNRNEDERSFARVSKFVKLDQFGEGRLFGDRQALHFSHHPSVSWSLSRLFTPHDWKLKWNFVDVVRYEKDDRAIGCSFEKERNKNVIRS